MPSNFTRRDFMRVAGAGAASAAFAPHAFGTPDGVPRIGSGAQKNILLIMADDLGARELGCYGHPTHQTPNLDRLAQNGTQFQTCYAAPVCSPSRVMLMTGQYGFRNGWCDMRGRPGTPLDSPKVNLGEYHVTFADMVKDAGYKTAVAGKWQLPGEHPTRVYDTGFDEYLIWAYLSYVPDGVDYKGGYGPPGKKKSSRFYHPGVMRNGEHLDTDPADFGPDLYTDFLIDFMRRNRDDRFLAYFPMTLTHTPWGPTPDDPDLPRGKNTPAALKAFVEYTDKLVGRMVDALDEMGLREDTVIMFTGDNGTQSVGKYSPTELGARVPLIVNCPGTVQQGVVTEELADLSDFMPTISAFTGAALPQDRVIDGNSFAHTVAGAPGPTREWAFSFLSDKRVLRDKQWLVEYNSPDEFGHFFYCGDSRDGTGYREMTHSIEPEALEARKRFARILKDLPVPPMTGAESAEYREKMLRQMRKLPDLSTATR